jgi:hypothetical protein
VFREDAPSSKDLEETVDKLVHMLDVFRKANGSPATCDHLLQKLLESQVSPTDSTTSRIPGKSPVLRPGDEDTDEGGHVEDQEGTIIEGD